MGPVGIEVPPLESGSAVDPREGDSQRSLGVADSPSRPSRARETTTNIRASLKEKEAWEPLARAAGFIRHQAGVEVGNVSAWLRHLGNREVERTAGGKG